MAGYSDEVLAALKKTGASPEELASERAAAFGDDPNYIKPTVQESTKSVDEELMSSIPAETPDEPAQSSPPAANVATPEETPPQPAEVAAPSPAPAARQPVVKPVPKGTPAPVAKPQMPSDDPQYFSRKASSGSLQNTLEAEQNRTLDTASALGDKEHGGDIRAAAAAEQAAKYSELEGIQEANRLRAEERVELNSQQKQQLEERLFRKVDELSDKIRNPPKDTMRTVLGIVGIAMAAAGNSRGASVTQAIGQAISSKMQKWEAGIAADQEELKQLHGLFDMQNPDSESELRAAAQMSQLAVSQFDSALKSIEADAQSGEAKAAAQMVRSQLLQQYGKQQLQLRSQMAAKRRQDEMYRVLRSARSPEEAAALTASMGKEGQAALRDIAKTDGDQVGVDKTAAEVQKVRAETGKTQAETVKTLNEAAGGGDVEAGDVPPVGYELNPAAPGAWKSAEKQNRAQFAEGAAKIPQLAQNLRDYTALLKKHGTETLPTEAKAKLQALHSQILSGVKDAAQLGALDNGVIALVEREIGDPTAWNLGLGNTWEQADKRAETTLQSILADHNAKTRTLGLVPKAGATGTAMKTVSSDARAAGAESGGMVQMVNPGTKQRLAVHPSKVARAKAMGFTEE